MTDTSLPETSLRETREDTFTGSSSAKQFGGSVGEAQLLRHRTRTDLSQLTVSSKRPMTVRVTRPPRFSPFSNLTTQ